jgi:hypothetical protein
MSVPALAQAPVYIRTRVKCPGGTLNVSGSLPIATQVGNYVIQIAHPNFGFPNGPIGFTGQYQSYSIDYDSTFMTNQAWMEIHGTPSGFRSHQMASGGGFTIATETITPPGGTVLVLVLLVGTTSGTISGITGPWPLTLIHSFTTPQDNSCLPPSNDTVSYPAVLVGTLGTNLGAGVVSASISTAQYGAPYTLVMMFTTDATQIGPPPSGPMGLGACSGQNPKANFNVLPAVPSPYPLLHNMRSYVPDRYETRPGLSLISGSESPLHSVRRLSNSVPGASVSATRVVGAGADLWAGLPTLAQIDSGYTGDPLSMVPYRPTQSPECYMYVADRNKNVKVRADGTVTSRGIAPPLKAPAADIDVPLVRDAGITNAVTGWTGAGTTSAGPSNNSLLSTIADGVVNPAVGGAFIVPHVWVQPILPGAPVGIGIASLGLLVQSINKASFATTIAAIQYDSGSTGACSIVLTQNVDPTAGFTRDCIVQINGTEYVRIEAVTVSRDGVYAARATTSGSYVPGQTIQAFPSFRVNTKPVTVGTIVGMNSILFFATVGIATVSKTVALDFSYLGLGARPASPDDFIHLDILADHPENIIEVRLLLDVDSFTNDFTHNYYYVALRQSDITPADTSAVTTLSANQSAVQFAASDAAVQTSQSYQPGGINTPPQGDLNFRAIPGAWRIPQPGGGLQPRGRLGINAPSAAVARGQNQMTAVDFPIGSLTRVGNDLSRTLANIQAVRIQVQVSDTTGFVFNGITLRGGYGPLVSSTGNGLVYRYRGRSKATGAKSLWSPPTRYGLLPNREPVVVPMTQHPDPQVDTLDVFRFGSDISTGFIFAGSTPNSATPSFRDTFSDDELLTAQPAGFPNLIDDDYVPYPDIDVTHTGVCHTIGSTVIRDSGDLFNLNWAPGSLINIAGVYYTLYAQPTSGSQLEIVENAGVQSAVAFSFEEPTLMGVSLPTLWGPWDNRLWSVGSCLQPGYIFASKGNDPDAASDADQWEITSPSEPLINGFLLNQQNYVFSSEKIYWVVSQSSGAVEITGTAAVQVGAAGEPYSFYEVAQRGLYSRWAFAVGNGVCYFLSKDGIYKFAGSGAVSITADPWRLLFPREGANQNPVILGSDTIYPPDFSQIMRLSYATSFLYFDYIDTQGQPTTLVYSELLNIWQLDTYAGSGGGAIGINVHYSEEGSGLDSLVMGGSDGNLYACTGTTEGSGAGTGSEIALPYFADVARDFVRVRDGEFGLITSGTTTLYINAGGADYQAILASTGGVYKKLYQPLPAVKSKDLQFRILSTVPLIVFARDTKLRLSAWGGDLGEYEPFSAIDRYSKPGNRT